MPTTITDLDEQPIERGTFVVTVTPKDDTGAAVTPSAMSWTLTDMAGAAVNSRTDVSVTPGTSVAIVLSGADLQVGTSFLDNRRELLIKFTYTSSAGSGLPGREYLRFEVRPTVGES